MLVVTREISLYVYMLERETPPQKNFRLTCELHNFTAKPNIRSALILSNSLSLSQKIEIHAFKLRNIESNFQILISN